MVQILQAVDRGPSLGQRLSGGFGRALEAGQQAYSKHKTGQALQRMTGEDLSDLDPEMQKAILVAHLQGQNEINKQKMKTQQKNEFYKMLGLDVGGESQSQSSPNRFAQSMQEPITPEQAHQESFMGEQAPQGQQMPKGQQQPTQNKKDAQSWYDGLNDQQRNLLALENPAAANALERGREFKQRQNLAEREFAQKEEKFAEEKRKSTPEYKREEELNASQAKSDVKFYNDLQERRGKQILKQDSLNRLKNINKKDVSGKAYESFLEKSGLTSLTSTGRRELSAEVKNQFTDFKQVAGSQLSASEFFVLAGAYPNADFTPEANAAIIDNLEQVHDTLNKEYEIAERLKKENSGKIPENYQSKINNELQNYLSKRMDKIKDNIRITQNAQYGIPKGFTLMFDKEGEPLSVPENKVAEILENDWADLP